LNVNTEVRKFKLNIPSHNVTVLQKFTVTVKQLYMASGKARQDVWPYHKLYWIHCKHKQMAVWLTWCEAVYVKPMGLGKLIGLKAGSDITTSLYQFWLWIGVCILFSDTKLQVSFRLPSLFPKTYLPGLVLEIFRNVVMGLTKINSP